MGSNGKHCLDQLSHAYILNLQLQWTPMGSNGNHRLDQLSHAYIHPQSPTPMDSYGLQWYAGLSPACIILNLQMVA